MTLAKREDDFMAEPRQEIEREIAEHRRAIAELESRLRASRSAATTPQVHPWPPPGFYLTFYVVVGAILGILGSLASFLFNVFGSLMVDQDPYRILRVYGTVFLGQDALTTDNLNFFMLVAVVHFSVGALAGAVFHVALNRFDPNASAARQIGLGAGYGVLMWIVNFYLVLWWLEPALVGRAYVLELMPVWVAALTHIVYGVTLGILQPLGRFTPYSPVEARA
jgi:hypothetical protein